MVTGGRKSPAACLAGAIILTCYLVQTVDCLDRLRKKSRSSAQSENIAAAAGVQEGEIVFADAPSGSSVHDETGSQTNFADWFQENEGSMEEWNHLGASVLCFDDHMSFTSVGYGASQLSVERITQPLMPLSMVPPECGYKMHGNSFVFVMMVPYDGCNVVQQAGNYKLPLRWKGHQVSLLCPKRVKTSAPHWQQIPLMDFQYPTDPSVSPAEPVKTLPTFPKFTLYPYWPPTAAASTTPLEPEAPHLQIPFDPYLPWPVWAQLPDAKFLFPQSMPEKSPQSPEPALKTTATPYATPSPAGTQPPPVSVTPPGIPAQFYSPGFVPFRRQLSPMISPYQ